MPPKESLRRSDNENLAWLGRASALVEAWNMPKMISMGVAIQKLYALHTSQDGLNGILILLHQARHDLRMKTVGPLSAAIGRGNIFDYFDEVRKIIAVATHDLFFVDPYLDADFVSRYLPHVAKGVNIRLLAREKLSTLSPAVEAFAKQNDATISIRSASNFHDRYVFVDRNACYQSGASFKDGAKSSPTTLTQITDAFPSVLQTYEGLWDAGKVER